MKFLKDCDRSLNLARPYKSKLFTHETSINAGFTKDHENLVCEFHVTFKNHIIHT